MNPRPLEPFLVTLLIVTLGLFYTSAPISSQIDPASEWHLLYIKIRDRLIPKEEALSKLKELEALLKDYYLKNSEKELDERLCFPLKGYSFHFIGGKGGNGYQPQGYDFFDGNDHKGHPGHDIFIRDKNQDGLDDITGKPVEVISASPGMVVSVHSDWKSSSSLRGGNYIWIFEPIKNRYYYYAHLNEIFVKVGQIVSKGDRLGTVGRTGVNPVRNSSGALNPAGIIIKSNPAVEQRGIISNGVNAYPKRSPTHLHFVAHESINGYPKPINPHTELIQTH